MATITCTACGSTVSAYVDDTSPWDAKVVIECDETSCGATWDGSGNVVRSPEQFRAQVAALAARHSTG